MLYIEQVALRPSIFLKSQVLPNKVAIGSRLNANEISGNGEPNPTHPPFRNPKLTLMGQTAGPAALSHSLTAPQTTYTASNFCLLLQQSPSRLQEGAVVPPGTREWNREQEGCSLQTCSQPSGSDLGRGGRVPAFPARKSLLWSLWRTQHRQSLEPRGTPHR